LTLAVETLVLIAVAWMVLSAVRFVPFVGRKHRVHDGSRAPRQRKVAAW
jgi:hypothetical protein